MKLWAEGKSKAYIYTRYGNPTLTVAQEKIAALEGAEAAVVTASGMAAISCALLGALKAGDELISTAQLYGGSYRLMRDIFPGMGIKVHHVETDLAGMEEKLSSKTQSFVRRNAHESHAAPRGSAQSRGLREKTQTDFDYRQYVCHAHAAESHCHGLRHGGAQRHQSARRPFRHHRREWSAGNASGCNAYSTW